MNQTTFKHSLFPIGSELARNLFPLENTNNIKIKVTHHRVKEMNAFGKKYHLRTLSESVSLLHQVLRCNQ